MMRFTRCAALLAALAVLLAGATAEGAPTKQGRLVSFRSCGELLAYAKSQATRFVTPWGFGNGLAVGMPPVAGPDGAPTRDTSPQQGVDYSGTNVQEQGVD